MIIEIYKLYFYRKYLFYSIRRIYYIGPLLLLFFN